MPRKQKANKIALKRKLYSMLLVILGLGLLAGLVAIPPRDGNDVLGTSSYQLPYLYPNSYWTVKVPANAPLHPQSAQIATAVQNQANDHYTGLGVNTINYAPSFFVANGSLPRVNFGSNNCQSKPAGWDVGLLSQLSNVPMPTSAQPSSGTDKEMVIYEPATDTVWNTWITNPPSAGGWNACWGGRITGASTSNAIFTNPYGTTAAGLELTAGAIYPHELEAATPSSYDTIKHALHIAMPYTACYPSFSWPANRTDGYCASYAPNPLQGSRMRLNPNFVIPSDWHPTTKAIARAMQDYGVVVRDTAGAVVLYGINTNSFPSQPDPWPSLLSDWPELYEIPLSQLQVLQTDWGKPETATDYRQYLPVSAPASPSPNAPGGGSGSVPSSASSPSAGQSTQSSSVGAAEAVPGSVALEQNSQSPETANGPLSESKENRSGQGSNVLESVGLAKNSQGAFEISPVRLGVAGAGLLSLGAGLFLAARHFGLFRRPEFIAFTQLFKR